ncbi:hypothetical protein BC937DRAFT_92142 [Endogone sp. FLAS-F59071]|nr:hypothetical protein BC937DRAFT_92142 [Endogone sp. FLAS-F59071]|eukprot:RUS21598.1 hypothetical protein BC937DRAFT_92142 [Endogone sp. FLAS-F59071]
MSAIAQKKQEEKNQKIIRDLLKLPENRKCFDCPTKAPFYVNLNIQTFICAKCSGLVREIGHRIKSISASIFTPAEIAALQVGGNGVAAQIWLARYHATGSEPEHEDELRDFIRQKYVERKWIDEVALREHFSKVAIIAKAENGTLPKLPSAPLNPLAAYTAQQQAEYQSKHFPVDGSVSPPPSNQPAANQYIPTLGGLPSTTANRAVNLLGDGVS